MSDTRAHYTQIGKRARDLRERLDEAIHALLMVDQGVSKIAKADLGLPGELRLVEQQDLQHSVQKALFTTRAAEYINERHIGDVDREMSALGLDPTTTEGGETS